MDSYIIKKSSKKDKKYMVLHGKKKVHFGAIGYEDFTTHKDRDRMSRYVKRHAANEDWKDLSKPGTWSRYILWSKPSLTAAVRDMAKRFNIKIKLQK